MSVLLLDELEVRYGAVRAVRGLSLEVARGEIVGLIGPNGAGKSSTLHAVMGAAPVAGGDVRLGDRSLVGRSSEAIARSGVALVPEGRRIFAELTVEENLRLGLAPRIVDVVFGALTAIRDRGIAVLLVEQRAQRTVALADRTYVIANGELRLTLGPEDAADTDRLVAAYLA